MKKIGYFLLPIFAFSSAIGSSAAVYQSRVNSLNEQRTIRKENPNNHPYIDYNDADNHGGVGGDYTIDIGESSTRPYLQVSGIFINVNMKEGINWNLLNNELERVYFTLYDVTDGGFEAIETVSRINSTDYTDQIDLGAYAEYINGVVFFLSDNTEFKFSTRLEEFHKYKVGFNINEGDDLQIYSDYYELSTPNVNSFSISTTETEMIFQWDFAKEMDSIKFDFKEVYAKINGKRYLLGNDATGTKTISDLNAKTKYSVSVGYTATKIISDLEQYEISAESDFLVSTSMPQNFSGTTIIVSLILLIILILIFLVLLGIILYWNNQRKKVTGLALVAEGGNDSEDNYYDSEADNNFEADDYQEIDEYYNETEQNIEEWSYE